MKRKKTVRKIRPVVKYGILLFISFIFFYWLWSNFSQFIIKKDTTLKVTEIQSVYKKQYQSSKGEEKAKALGQLFASEFFTWRDHLRKGQIGGIEYVASDISQSFREEVYSSYYDYFTEIRDLDGNAALPQVKSIEVLAIKRAKMLPLSSRVWYNPNISPKHLLALDFNIKYDASTKNESRYHHHGVVYMKLVKGEYRVVKLVSN